MLGLEGQQQDQPEGISKGQAESPCGDVLGAAALPISLGRFSSWESKAGAAQGGVVTSWGGEMGVAKHRHKLSCPPLFLDEKGKPQVC